MSSDATLWAASAAALGAVSALVSAAVALKASARLRSHVEELTLAIEAHPPTDPSFDVFVSYSFADADFADDLVRALRGRGVRVWNADDQLQIGDSIAQSIADGLARSQYGVVLLSHAFLRGAWPRKELSVFSQRRAEGHGKILPIWIDVSDKEIREKFPALADIMAMHKSKESVDHMADSIAEIVGR